MTETELMDFFEISELDVLSAFSAFLRFSREILGEDPSPKKLEEFALEMKEKSAATVKEFMTAFIATSRYCKRIKLAECEHPEEPSSGDPDDSQILRVQVNATFCS